MVSLCDTVLHHHEKERRVLGSNVERFPGFVVEAKEQVYVGVNAILCKK